MNKKYISIIVPFYNTQPYILRTIRSIQDFFKSVNYEIILINDGSSDSIINFESDDNIILVTQGHHGVSYARNNGIRHASGKYIMFCDSDDLLIGTFMPQNYEEDIISFSSSCVKNELITGKNEKRLLINNLFGFSNSKSGYYGGSVSKLFKKSFLIENSLIFDENLSNSEDVLFNIRAILLAKSIKLEKRGVYSYIKRKDSTTHIYNKLLLKNHIYFLKQVKDVLPNQHSKDTFSKIKSLYLYQLVFRYFAYEKREARISDYIIWCKEAEKAPHDNWNIGLNRSIEKLTIIVINHFGINAATLLAKTYIRLKQFIIKSGTKSEIL